VIETIAEADASTAWMVMNAMGGCFLTGFMPKEGAERVTATPQDCAATAVGRLGKATAVEGGYLVEAHWPFLSGSPHATWIGGLCMVYDGDEPRMSLEGQPYIVLPFIRKERVEMLDTWHATGLKGTGSHDAKVQGAFVPTDEVADFSRGPRPELPLLFSIEENAIAPLLAAGVALGAARSAAGWFRESATHRQHQSGGTASAAPLPQLALAEAEARIARSFALLHALANEGDDLLARGELPGETFITRVSLAATAGMEDAIEVVSKLYRAAGSTAVFTGSALERAFRDVYTLGAHRMVQRENYLVHGPALFPAA
jgi:alkylation response protein AidB-like acyl-CoA dehydrogenase